MTKKLCLFLILAFCFVSLKAQPFEKPCHHCYPPWGTTTMNLASVIGSNANFHSLIPLEDRHIELEIENLSASTNDVLMVGVSTDGKRYLDLFRIESNGVHSISSQVTSKFTRLHLMSLSEFGVQGTSADSLDLEYRAADPVDDIRKVQAKTPTGSVITVGVTQGGNAYYPVIGYPFGTYDKQTRTLTREDGAVFEVAD